VTVLPTTIPPTLDRERQAWAAGARWVAGVDEVGRGALAGPVVAAAVVLGPEPGCVDLTDLVRDSKLLSAGQRCAAYPAILAAARAVGVGAATPLEVDALGIARATELAMLRALDRLPRVPDLVLVDGYPVRLWRGPQRHFVRGDRLVLSIAAASIVAKVRRDAAMIAMDLAQPGYGFDRHKGYGTAEHRAALRELGATAEHRVSWARPPTEAPRAAQPVLLGLAVDLSPAVAS
jgi:ribonuclease HII